MSPLTGTGLRERALQFINTNLAPRGYYIPSGAPWIPDPTDPDFLRLTNCTQRRLLDAWANKSPLTTCNLFVGVYSDWLFKKPLGRFDLATWLPSIGREIAWIRADSGTSPACGDIFIQQGPPSPRHPKGLNHMGISIDFDSDGKWYTAEAGQGGPISGFDLIKMRDDNDITDCVTGWADINLIAQCVRQIGPVPDWLAGLWQVFSGGQVWYYYFGADRKVAYTVHDELIDRLPSVNEGQGRFAYNPPDGSVVTRWTSTGTGEQFWQVPGADGQMCGYVNGQDQIEALKFDPNTGSFGGIGTYGTLS